MIYSTKQHFGTTRIFWTGVCWCVPFNTVMSINIWCKELLDLGNERKRKEGRKRVLSAVFWSLSSETMLWLDTQMSTLRSIRWFRVVNTSRHCLLWAPKLLLWIWKQFAQVLRQRLCMLVVMWWSASNILKPRRPENRECMCSWREYLISSVFCLFVCGFLSLSHQIVLLLDLFIFAFFL